MTGGRRKRNGRKRNRTGVRTGVRTVLLAILALPAAYLLAALIGSLLPVNRGWTEPGQGTTVYLADNGVHVDILMPVNAQGLDWAKLFPKSDFGAVAPNPGWIAFGAGEKHVYLDTPTWSDLTLRTALSGLTGGDRVMHVEYVPSPYYAVRQIRLRPAEYRRLWSAIRSDLAVDRSARPKRIDHPGYGPYDAFYRTPGKASAVRTCNSWVGGKLRVAGVRTSLWTPFAQGLVWRYRRAGQST